MGRFLTRDTWSGDANRPLSLNRWGYVEGNPVLHTDPSGHDPWWCEDTERYPSDDDKQKCYDDYLIGGWQYWPDSEVNLILL